jgi:NAD(P)-dependent dehydrogenase (short-subunit alcohol dehydrogenase family)
MAAKPSLSNWTSPRVPPLEILRRLLNRLCKTNGSKETFDYLVKNAGIAQRTLIKDLSEGLFDQLVNVHFKGPAFLT